MKSTAMSGVKQFLKPDAYKQSEGCGSAMISGLTAYLLYNGSASWSWQQA